MSSAMPDDRSPSRNAKLVRALAWIVVALMVATVVLSAYMRLRLSGLGCAPWPACYAQATAAPLDAAAAQGVEWARLAHRVVASLVLVLSMLLVLAARAMQPPAAGAMRSALVLLALTLALALLGVTMRGSTLPAVVLGNLLGGFLMLALALRLAWPAAPTPPAMRALLLPALVLLLAQIALGAMSSALRGALACDDLGSCLQGAAAQPWHPGLLDPWRSDNVTTRLAWLQLLHRGLALALLPLLAGLALMLWRALRRGAATVLAALLALQMLLGNLAATAASPLPQVLAHNLSAALLLALLLRLA